MLQRVGFWLGVALFAAMLAVPPPADLSIAGWRVAAVTVLIGCWWFTEAVPVTLTGSLPFLVLPLLGVTTPEAVAGQYMSPVLFLILGGALVGLAFEKWNLHRRVALFVVSRVDPEPKRLLLALMGVTAFVSMFVNNSATTVMMLPIALAVLTAILGAESAGDTARSHGAANFAAATILSISFASNIGGFATPIGTPVNSIAIGILDRSYGVSVSFVEWMSFGVPFMLLGIPLCWAILVRWTLPFELPGVTRERVQAGIGHSGPMGPAERRVLAIVLGVAAAWVLQPLVTRAVPGLTDAGIAILGALVLCLVPSGNAERPRLLDWEDAKRAPWYLILLLGGGLALADAVVKSGLSAWLGTSLAAVSDLPLLPMLLAIAVMCALITEAASNVATATIFMPIAAGLALGAGYDPTLGALAAAMAANLGFANPAATSSNALVYSTGRVPITAMLKSGLAFDVVGAVLIACACAVVVPALSLG